MDDKANKLSSLLRRKHLLLASAESCTGGMFAAAITDIPGSSDIFDRGFVTYSNAAKRDLLGVSEETLNSDGAVSAKCASEMAEGAIKNSEANVSVAVTGIAGPEGGTPEKPVGMVYIATCLRDYEPIVKKCNFSGDRGQVRLLACSMAFDLLIKAADSV